MFYGSQTALESADERGDVFGAMVDCAGDLWCFGACFAGLGENKVYF